MAHNRQTRFQSVSPSYASRPLEHLERIQPVYFYTPDIEREINRLDGVTSCRVLSTGVEIEEIHVISPPDRTPKKIVRDIESLLLVHFGIRIDHRRISVVQLGQATSPLEGLARPRIARVDKATTSAGVEVRVEIDSQGRTVIGMASAEPGESDSHLSSRALLLALEQLLNREGVLSVHEVASIRVGPQELVIALLRSRLGEPEEVLVGASVARGDPLRDAARATFDAVNRKLVRAHRPATKQD